ncbi:hypothetical protein GCM10009799_27670 [Nocardiopsis rhodophaea]|uniref:DUF4034 domain-containing protein n=1 Tax=Nocardiopsis rhodophaea TaxID=280238 RepID=A0ABP5EHX8_9ACTN
MLINRLVDIVVSIMDKTSGMEVVWDVWEDPELERILPDIRAGRLTPGLDLVKAAGENWDLRALRIDVLSREAAARLDSIEKLAGDDADGLLWLGSARIRAAWNIRGAARARYVSSEQFEKFWEGLSTAPEPLLRAAELRPNDPVPWDCLQWFGLGMQLDRSELDNIWDQLCARAPRTCAGHFSRAQVLCNKWQGSNEEVLAFAREVASSCQAGDPRAALLPLAHFEVIADLLDDTESDEDSLSFVRKCISSPGVAAEIADAADRWLVAAQPHPHSADAAHLFGAAAYYAGDAHRARELLKHAGRRVSPYLPWGLARVSAGRAYAKARRELGI